jgi:hypothetical protein
MLQCRSNRAAAAKRAGLIMVAAAALVLETQTDAGVDARVDAVAARDAIGERVKRNGVSQLVADARAYIRFAFIADSDTSTRLTHTGLSRPEGCKRKLTSESGRRLPQVA